MAVLQVDSERGWEDCTLFIHSKDLDGVGIAVFGLCSWHFE